MKIQQIARVLVVIASVGVALLTWSNHVHRVHALPAWSVVPDTPEEIAQQRAEERQWQQIQAGGGFYKPLEMVADFPGVEQPTLLDVESVELPLSTPIVGVEVDGEFCAFVLESMLDPRHHIVNLMLKRTPLSVTYCNLVDCVRVLTRDSETPIPLRVGGLDVDRQMVLLLDETRYGQSSGELPLQDHEFVRMTLSEWANLHPATKVYVGPNA